jgi:HlyD family secretion protein
LSVPIQSVTTRDEKKPNAGMPPKDNSTTDDTKAKTASTPTSKEYVFVYNAGTVKQVQVTTGIQDDSNIIILSGLKNGDEVVSAPYTAISKTLNDKMKVEKVDKSKLFTAPGQ